jgi:hypothetical protein
MTLEEAREELDRQRADANELSVIAEAQELVDAGVADDPADSWQADIDTFLTAVRRCPALPLTKLRRHELGWNIKRFDDVVDALRADGRVEITWDGSVRRVRVLEEEARE